MEDCLFCRIIAKEIPGDIVFENEKVIAFKDIHPVAPVHILVIPKIHIQDMNAITAENVSYIEAIYQAISMIAKEAGVFERGYRVICNCGEEGGQLVPHLHFHLIGGKKLGSKICHES